MTVTGAEAIGGFGGGGGVGANAGYDANNVYWGPGAGGAGHDGGFAYADAVATTNDTAQAIALGGVGGNSGVPGRNLDGSYGGAGNQGGVGGFATATSVNDNSFSFATATSTAIGGAGGVSYGAGFAGGAGGLVTNTKSRSTAAAGESILGRAATAMVLQQGGAGGLGRDGATGGVGAASTAVNAVTGYTNGGVLTLSQTAIAGAGGSSDKAAGGAGGNAVSSLTFSDNGSVTKSATIDATVTATGGAGGTGGTVGAAGTGVATLVVVGAGAVNAASVATGGSGMLLAGTAVASTTVTGTSGAYAASAQTSLSAGQLITSVSSTTGGAVNGESLATATAGIGGLPASVSTVGQGVAFIEGAPSSTGVSAVLTANANIAAAFGASPVFFGIAELGGGHSTGAAATQTVTSTVDESVDLTKLKAPKDLMVGFYQGAAVGGGVSSVTFDLYADGVDVDHQTFASAAAAQAYFTNNAVDLGSLASGPLSGSTLSLQATMSVTTTAAGSGFFGSMIIGDPPVASHGVSPNAFVQAMASMGGGSGAVVPIGSSMANVTPIALATPTHAA